MCGFFFFGGGGVLKQVVVEHSTDFVSHVGEFGLAAPTPSKPKPIPKHPLPRRDSKGRWGNRVPV